MTLDQLLKLFEERVQNRFFGKYAGVVTDVEDPLEVGRIRARVPAVLGEEAKTGWALPCAPFGGGRDRGFLMLPEVGDTVWMEFAAGDVSQPIWTGAFWGAPDSAGQQDDLAKEPGSELPTAKDAKAGPGRHILRTAAGHRLLLDDTGDIVLTHGSDEAEIRLTRDGEVVIKAKKLKLGDGASEPLVLGEAFMQVFNSHTHMVPPPTGSPVPSGPPEPLKMSQVHLSKTSFTE